MHWIRLRFMKYRFVRYWFKYVSRPWLDTDIPSKHFVCLLDVLKTCLQDAFKRSSRSLEDQQMFAGIKWNKYRSEMTNQAKVFLM